MKEHRPRLEVIQLQMFFGCMIHLLIFAILPDESEGGWTINIRLVELNQIR